MAVVAADRQMVVAWQYQVLFAPQTASGAYSLTIGPDVADTLGRLIDQDRDGTAGEATDDQYTSRFYLAPFASTSAAVTTYQYDVNSRQVGRVDAQGGVLVQRIFAAHLYSDFCHENLVFSVPKFSWREPEAQGAGKDFDFKQRA